MQDTNGKALASAVPRGADLTQIGIDSPIVYAVRIINVLCSLGPRQLVSIQYMTQLFVSQTRTYV